MASPKAGVESQQKKNSKNWFQQLKMVSTAWGGKWVSENGHLSCCCSTIPHVWKKYGLEPGFSIQHSVFW